MLASEQEPVGEEAGSAIQGALGGNPSQFRQIVTFREVGEDHIGSLAVVVLLKKRRRCIVRQMSYAGEDALLDRPGVRAVAEHFQIVVRLQQQ